MMAAALVVSVVVGVVVPALLVLLSLIFGKKLRTAAGACHRGSKRAVSAIWRASRAVYGPKREDDAPESEPKIRISPDSPADVLRRVRAVTPEEAQREAMEAAEREADEDAEEWAARRATEEAERWEPPEAWRLRDDAEAAAAAKRKRTR
jgi:hypothetical protein